MIKTILKMQSSSPDDSGESKNEHYIPLIKKKCSDLDSFLLISNIHYVTMFTGAFGTFYVNLIAFGGQVEVESWRYEVKIVPTL